MISGIRGLMLAALLAAIMSTLTSVFNSASSLVTLDLWGQFRKNASQKELMVVGRVTVLVMVGISIIWLPILQQQQGGVLWFYLAAIIAYFAVPWCMAFLLGLFWKRATEPVSRAFFTISTVNLILQSKVVYNVHKVEPEIGNTFLILKKTL